MAKLGIARPFAGILMNQLSDFSVVGIDLVEQFVFDKFRLQQVGHLGPETLEQGGVVEHALAQAVGHLIGAFDRGSLRQVVAQPIAIIVPIAPPG